MTWTVNDKEFATVLALDGAARYEHLVKRVADWREIWGLADANGWAIAADASEREALPVWPHARFAEACAIDAWAGRAPRSIDIAAWLERWIPGLIRDERLVATFPTPVDRGVLVSPDRFELELRAELARMD
jgi:hypothetical protein